jgi:predicted Rossmann fold flavoprotein
MAAAITAKRCGNDVTILEKNNNLGKKLLLTGNGRCNYFNSDMSLSNFYSSSDVSKFINGINLNKLNEFYDSIGLLPRVKDGYYYPYSNTATAVQNSLAKTISVLGVKIINEEVIDITKTDRFTIRTNENTYRCDKVILATGGITYPKTGSTGFGYDILKKFGHNIIEPKAALVPLLTDENVRDWAGIRVNVNASLYVDKTLVATQSGEAQLTESGISGICIMNLSRFVDLTKENTLSINFLPIIEDIYDFIDNRNKKLKGRTIIELLEMVINYKLLYFIFRKLHINTDSRWDNLTNLEKEVLIDSINNYKLNIVSVKGLEYGETTCGGVILDEITNSCESVKVKGLYVTGELIDVDAVCGGYNLTNAFITGILAGESND